MYKTVFIDHRNGGYEIQLGNLTKLESLINRWADNGWELVTITPAPYPIDASNLNYILVFKK